MNIVTVESYEKDGKTHVVSFLRNENGREIKDEVVKPYFFKHTEEKTNLKFFKCKYAEKVVVDSFSEIKDLTKGFRTGEADVRPTMRYLIDSVPVFNKINLRVHYTDIEKDVNTGKIISIAVYENYLKKCVAFVWRQDLPEYERKNKKYSFPSGYTFDATVHFYNDEKNMLNDFIEFVRDTDPDLLTGWYFTSYDAPELINRINQLGLKANRLSPIDKAYVIGETVNKYKTNLAIKGRVLFDMLEAYSMLQQSRLQNRSLEEISQKVLHEGKAKHTNFKEIWNNIDELVEYNCIDAVLVYRIDQKSNLLNYYDILRRIVGCEWSALFSKTLLWDTYILRKTHNVFALPTKKSIQILSAKGATVLKSSKKGLYKNILLIDFTRLYPSSIIMFNMSPETLVETEEEYNPEIHYRLPNGIMFYKKPMGLLPTVLLEMFELRKKIKVQMKEKDEHGNYKYPVGSDEYEALDNQQFALKILINSLYGAMGFHSFRLATPEIVACTTLIGRLSLKKKIEILTNTNHCSVVYGDSVLPDEPIIIKNGNNIDVKTISEAKNGELVWSDNDFTTIKQVIKKPLSKRIFKVNTQKGLIDVTEDHSLLNNDGQEISPLKINNGCVNKFNRDKINAEIQLMHKDLPCSVTNKFKKDVAWLYGLFVSQGYAQIYQQENHVGSLWKISLNSKEFLDKAKNIIYKEFNKKPKVTVHPTLLTNVYNLIIENGNCDKHKQWTEHWRKIFYTPFGKKKIPKEIFNAPIDVKKAFLEGYGVGNGFIMKKCECYKDILQDFTTNSKSLALGLVLLLESIGENYSLDVNEQKPDFININVKSLNDKQPKWFIKSIKEEPTLFDRVYDLETENHHFHCGVGQMIVHNTDSVFIQSLNTDLNEMIKEIYLLVETVNTGIKDFYEKELGVNKCYIQTEAKTIYKNLMMSDKKTGKKGDTAKKRYAGLRYWVEGQILDVNSNEALEIKGYEQKRSNNSQLSQDLQKELFKVILGDSTKEDVKKCIQKFVNGIKNNVFDLKYIGISQGLNRNLEEYASDIPHRRGALYSNQYLGTNFGIGDKPRLIYVSSTGRYPKTDVVAFDKPEDIPKDFNIDTALMVDKTVIMKIEHILDSVGFSIEEMVSCTKSLEDYF